MRYHELLLADTIDEHDFLTSFMQDHFRIHLQDKESFIHFCRLAYALGELKLGNGTKIEDFEKIYDEKLNGEGILFYMSRPTNVSLPGTYTMNNVIDRNIVHEEHWKQVVELHDVIRKLQGPISDKINAEIREKESLAFLFTRKGVNNMSRRIGNFPDPKTGETHWLEPETVRDYPLPPGRIAEFGQTGYRTVNYALSDNEADKTIELTATVELSNGQTVDSDPVAMDELRFAELLNEAYTNDHTFANKEEIKAYTESSLVSLAVNAFKEHGIVLHGLELDGFGSIFYSEDRVATFDSIKVTTEPYNPKAEIQLINSVSQTTLVAEKNPSATFVAHGHELSIPTFDFKEVQAGIVTQYTVESETVTTSTSGESNPFAYTYDDAVTTESPYMQERIQMLASAELEDNGFEDRFGDIFSL